MLALLSLFHSCLSVSLPFDLLVFFPHAVVLSKVAGVAVGFVVFLAIVVAITACLVLRQYKKSSLQRSMNIKTPYYTDDSNDYDSRR